MRTYFLCTERIGFSEWTENDIDLAKSLWGEKEVTEFICSSGIFTDKDIENRLNLELENNARYGVQYWPIFNMENDDLIGCCGLRPYDLEKYIYEIGFHLRHKYWGEGLASEAARAVITYAFDKLNAADIYAGHNPNNVNSKKALERLGFHFISNEYYKPTGLYHPSYRYNCAEEING